MLLDTNRHLIQTSQTYIYVCSIPTLWKSHLENDFSLIPGTSEMISRAAGVEMISVTGGWRCLVGRCLWAGGTWGWWGRVSNVRPTAKLHQAYTLNPYAAYWISSAPRPKLLTFINTRPKTAQAKYLHITNNARSVPNDIFNHCICVIYLNFIQH